jgi:hypothetical protein
MYPSFVFSENMRKVRNAVKGIGRILQMNVCLNAVEAVHPISTVLLLTYALARVDM